MSEEKVQPHIHPFNFFIVSRLEEIWHDISLANFNDAVQKLYHFTLFLEPKIQKKVESLMVEAEKYIVNPKLPCERFVVRFLSELTSLLHNEGYFVSAKQIQGRLSKFEGGEKHG
ncbi:MAG: hypothetical protein QXO67_02975 [Candidatus Bathyarchaeia archaeon]